MKRTAFVGIVLALALLLGLSLATASSSEAFFESSLVGLPAGMNNDPSGTIRTVPAAGAPWVSGGQARLDRDGKVQVDVEGLLLLNGTTGPVTGLRASLTCHGTNVVATTGVVPLDAAGKAEIDETIALPTKCVGPIVLIRVGRVGTGAEITGPWIAATGF